MKHVNALASLGRAGKQKFSSMTDPKDPPEFKNKEAHDAYYLQELLEKSKTEEPGFYNEYFKLRDSGDLGGSQAMIAAMGGLPAYTTPAKKSKTSVPVDWGKLGFQPEKSRGYRYNSGQGKPAVGSITKR